MKLLKPNQNRRSIKSSRRKGIYKKRKKKGSSKNQSESTNTKKKSNEELIKLSNQSETKMEIYEFDQICKELGIDSKNENDFILDLIRSFVKSGLDPYWKKEEDETGKVVYYYEPSNNSTYIHPHISRLKTALVDFLEMNDKQKAYNNSQKSEFILGRIKSLMTEKTEGTKQPEVKVERNQKKRKKKKNKKNIKKNLKKNKGTKQQTNEESTEEIQEEKQKTQDEPDNLDQVLKKGLYLSNEPLEFNIPMNTSNALNIDSNLKMRIINSKNLTTDTTEKEMEDENALECQDKFYQYCSHYYKQEYGFPLETIPKEFTKSKKFRSIPTQRAFQIFYQLGIQPNEGYLFNHAMLLDVLEIPPGIEVDKYSNPVKYLFKGQWIRNVFHPSLFYIRNNLEFLKEKYQGRIIKTKNFIFLDELGREFETDLQSLYKKWLTFPDMRKLMKYSTTEVDKDLFKGNDFSKIKKDYDKKLRGIMEKNYRVQNKQGNISSNVSDYHMLELLTQLKINLAKNIHLLFPIEEFIREKEAIGEWMFRIKPDGTKYWINHKDMTVSFKYPYLTGLKVRIEQFKYNIKEEKKQCILKKVNILVYLLKSKTKGLKEIEECKTKTFKIMESYLHSIFKASNRNGKSLRSKLNVLRKRLNRALIVKLSMEDYINLVFFCKFDLEAFILQNRTEYFAKHEKVFLTNANPDLELLAKFHLKNIQEKQKNKKTMFRFVTTSFTTGSKKIGRRASTTNSFSMAIKRRFLLKNKLKKGKKLNEDKLGPLADYMHLIDPVLRETMKENEGLRLGKKLLDSISNLKEFDNILLDCQNLLKLSDVDAKQLEDLIDNIQNIYQRIQKGDDEISASKLRALKHLKEEAIEKRNKLKKSELMFKKSHSSLIDQAISKGVKKPSQIKISNTSFEIEKKRLKNETSIGINGQRRASNIIDAQRGGQSDRRSDGRDLFMNFMNQKQTKTLGNVSDKHSLHNNANAFIDDTQSNLVTLNTEESEMVTLKVETDFDMMEKRKKSQQLKTGILNKLHHRLSIGANPGTYSLEDLNKISLDDPEKFRQLIKENECLTEEEKNEMMKQYDEVKKIEDDINSQITLVVPKKQLIQHLKDKKMTNLKGIGLLENGALSQKELDEIEEHIENENKKIKSEENKKKQIEFLLDSNISPNKIKNPKLPPVSLDLFGNREPSEGDEIPNQNTLITKRVLKTKIENVDKNKKKNHAKYFENFFKNETEENDALIKLEERDVHDLQALVNKTDFMKDDKEKEKYEEFVNFKIGKLYERLKKEEEDKDSSRNNLMIKGKGKTTKQEKIIRIPQIEAVLWHQYNLMKPNLEIVENEKEPVELIVKNLISDIDFDRVKVQEKPKFPKIFKNPSRNLSYARINNNIPIKFTQDDSLRKKIQLFILGWLSQKFNFPSEKIEILYNNDDKRRIFFDSKSGYFEFILSLIIKNPKLRDKAVNYVFDKEKNKGEFESMKRAKEIKKLKSQFKRRKDLIENKNKKSFKSKFPSFKIGKNQLNLINSTRKYFNFDDMNKMGKKKRLKKSWTSRNHLAYKSQEIFKKKKPSFIQRMKFTDEYIMKKESSYIKNLLNLYGKPSTLTRIEVQRLTKQEKLYLEIIPVINDIAYWMGIKAIKSTKNGNEGDLVWVAIMMFCHHRITRSNFSDFSNIKDKKWTEEMPYFKSLLIVQRERRKKFMMHRKREQINECMRGISWCRFWDRRNKCDMWYNFFDGSKEMELNRKEIEIFSRWFNYSS